MAKSNVFHFCFLRFTLLFVFTCLRTCVEGIGAQVKPIERIEVTQPQKPKTDIERLVESYSKYNGVKEKTGRNDGPEVEHILKTTGLRKGDSWCAALTYTSFFEAGIKGVPKSGYCPSWFQSKNIVYRKGKDDFETLKQGDVVGIFIPDKGRIGHQGFLHDLNPKKLSCITFEGNTSIQPLEGTKQDYDGQGACFKKRSKKSISKASRWVH